MNFAPAAPVGLVGAKLFGVPGGCNGFVTAAAVGANGKLYMGGDFTTCEQTIAFHVVEYDPVLRKFQALGSGAANGVNRRVSAIALYNDNLPSWFARDIACSAARSTSSINQLRGSV